MIDPDDKKLFAQLMLGLGETYAKETPRSLMRIYWDALLKYTIQQVGAAVQKHIGDPERGRYWPRPADLIAQIPRTRPEHQLVPDTPKLPPPTDDRHKARSACNRAYALRCASVSEKPGILQYEVGYDGQFPVTEFAATVPLPKSGSLDDHKAAWNRMWHDFDLVFAEPDMWEQIRAIGGSNAKNSEAGNGDQGIFRRPVNGDTGRETGRSDSQAGTGVVAPPMGQVRVQWDRDHRELELG